MVEVPANYFYSQAPDIIKTGADPRDTLFL